MRNATSIQFNVNRTLLLSYQKQITFKQNRKYIRIRMVSLEYRLENATQQHPNIHFIQCGDIIILIYILCLSTLFEDQYGVSTQC